jgi:hypothetical protein
VFEAQGRPSSDMCRLHGIAPAAPLLEGRIEVERIPQHDAVDHQAKRAQLLFLSFPIVLPQLPALAMERHPG